MEKVEYLVIGGGVTGLAVADALGCSGKRVLILERDEPGCGASGSNLGQTSVSDRDPGLELEMVRETLDLFGRLEPEQGLEYRRTGGSCVLMDPGDLPEAETLVRKKNAEGSGIRLLRGNDIQRAEPALENAAAVVYSPEEGGLNPLGVNNWLRRCCYEHGVEIRSQSPVLGFDCHNGRIVSVRTPEGRVSGDTVILSAGVWSRPLLKLLDLDIPVDAVRASAMVTQPCPPLIRGPVTDGTFFSRKDHGQQHVFLGGIQAAGGSILIAQANRDGSAGDKKVDWQDLSRVGNLFLSHFPRAGQLQIVRSWSGLTPSSLDGMPFWGFGKNVENLFLATAFKGAYSVAPAVGRLTARWLLEGSVPQGQKPWSPVRAGM